MRFQAWVHGRGLIRPTPNAWALTHEATHFFILVPLVLASCTPRVASSPPAGPPAHEAPDMILIPAGLFRMGSDAGPAPSRPMHTVYLDTYLIDRTEVTIADLEAYRAAVHAVMAASDELSAQGDKSLPAFGISWSEADAYCRWLGKRLPTEAEWEKAARSVDGRQYPWGNRWEPQAANTAGLEEGHAVPVGAFPEGASPYGVMDMAGNLAEWVADYYDPAYYSYASDHNPAGPTQVLDRGLRGGSWDSPREQVTTYFRDSSHSVLPNNRVGFRCALAAPDPSRE